MWLSTKRIVFSIIVIVGLILLLNCINFGDNDMAKIMTKNGGSMDTTTYVIYLEKSIDKFVLLGTVLTFLGGLGLVLDFSLNKKEF